MTEWLVIGSGPAGIACAAALLELGRRVVMLDVGRECESDRMKIVRAMSEREPEEWESEWPRKIGIGEPHRFFGATRKLVYGSDFPYVPDDEAGLVQDGVRCSLSWARGGLSNVWGAAMLPYSEEDIRDWPFRISELAPHYRAIAALAGVSGLHDALDELFGIDYPLAPPPPASAQAQWLIRRLNANRAALRLAGFDFGQSRLAVRDCRGCQLCLSGCPYDLIFRADHLLPQLQKNPRFRYCRGHFVDEIHESEDGISAVCHRPDDSRTEVSGTRAFLAAGVIGTAKIVFASLGQREAHFRINHHPYFLLPVVLLNSVGDPEREKLHTLAQVFLEIRDRAISEHGIHLQLYTYNPMFRDKLRSVLGCAPMLSRFAVIQGYLHSSEAEPISGRATMDAVTGRMKIYLHGRTGAGAATVIRKVRGKLRRHSWQLGFVPLPAMLQIGAPGDGNHIGGTFPMTSAPNGQATDTLGRLRGYSRLHIVDASVLPSLAATTLTFTAMANARRIAVAAAKMNTGSE